MIDETPRPPGKEEQRIAGRLRLMKEILKPYRGKSLPYMYDLIKQMKKRGGITSVGTMHRDLKALGYL